MDIFAPDLALSYEPLTACKTPRKARAMRIKMLATGHHEFANKIDKMETYRDGANHPLSHAQCTKGVNNGDVKLG